VRVQIFPLQIFFLNFAAVRYRPIHARKTEKFGGGGDSVYKALMFGEDLAMYGDIGFIAISKNRKKVN